MDKTIEYILEVARCGGIAKAARNLYITPSALSKYIIQKEEDLGVRLFNRIGNKFTLTYPGERYVEMLKELREKQNEMQKEMKRLADIYSGRLRVGVQMSMAELMTRYVISAMQDEYPNIRFLLEETSEKELDRKLRANQIDVALALAWQETEEFRYDRLCHSPVVIVAAKDSPLSAFAVKKEGFSHTWLPDSAILSETLILDAGGRSFLRYAGYLFDKMIATSRSNITVSNARTALLCVEQDLGIIVLPEILVRALRFQDKVALYSYGKEEFEMYLSVIYDPRSVLGEEIKSFREIVLESLKRADILRE